MSHKNQADKIRNRTLWQEIFQLSHPLTGEPVSTWYEPGETWNSVFGDISSAFEECRAECVGLFFSAHPEAMEAVGYTGQEAEALMLRAGFLAIETYSEDTGFWAQAHAQGLQYYELYLQPRSLMPNADVAKGREFFSVLTTPPKYLLELKRIISANRSMFVQAHTRITKNKEGESRVMLEEFDATSVGIIESGLARFKEWISDC
ncbi:hypothetical protein R1flu_027398 [Riccia fluitans]|uniref:Uncharacterized protein n=1 Tax=Riccia fluitans TaxID=41844 RepID=A0ABD1XIP5_9MARC